jgi:hypothetical protein
MTSTLVPLVLSKLQSIGVGLAAQLTEKLPDYQISIRPGLEWAVSRNGVCCGGFAYDDEEWIRVGVKCGIGSRRLQCPPHHRQEVRLAVNEVLEGMNRG